MQDIKHYSGIFLVDKPVGLSSFGVVARVRRVSEVKKVGHAGTLDPMASGLLIVLVGKDYTRQADTFLKLDKSYEAEITLGATSDTADLEGLITPKSNKKPSKADLQKCLNTFVGTIAQVPPRYSAIKIDGKRAYQKARSGEEFEIAPRKVTISAIKLLSYEYPKACIAVDVSSGTYIRSLAEDIGERLGTGAYLSELRRTRIGDYLLTDALPLEKLTRS